MCELYEMYENILDFKIDFSPAIDQPADLDRIAEI